MKIYSILTVFILAACSAGERVPVPKSEKFKFKREGIPFHGKVKSVVQTEYKYATGVIADNQDWSTKDEYSFNEEGLLTDWTSLYDEGTDLKYSNDGKGFSKTNFVSQKMVKKVQEHWSREGSEYVVHEDVDADGKKRTNTRYYDSTLQLLSWHEPRRSGESFLVTYRYKDGRLMEEISYPDTTRITYGPSTDTVKNYRAGILEYMTTSVYNEHGDPVQRLQTDRRLPENMYHFTYQYDNRGNWIVRKTTKDGSPEVTVTKREIKYY